MPTNWDELLGRYNIGFNPTYEQEDPFARPANQMSQPMPQYDFGPMQRYKDYLGTEPQRENYKPGMFRNVMNSLSAGFESMDTNLGRGAALYDALNDRDYDNAYKGWNSRGAKYKADVDLENTRYRNVTTDYDRMQDNKRQERGVDIQARNADTAEQRLRLEEKKHEDAGYQLVDGPNNQKLAVRVRGGQTEQMPTNIPNSNLTAEQRINQFNTAQNNAMTRHNTASGSARLGAQTSRQNTVDRINAAATEGDKDRSTSIWRHTTRSASMNEPKERVATPTNTNTPVELVKNGFNGRFDHPDIVEIDPKGNVSMITSDKERIKRGLRDISKKTNVPYEQLEQEWADFYTRMKRFAGGQ